MRITSCLLTMLLLFISSVLSYADDQPVRRRIGINLSAGLGGPTTGNHHFEYGLTNVKTRPRFSYSGGITYGPLEFISTSNVIISIEIATVEGGTPEKSIEKMQDGSAEFIIRVIPIMIWTTLITNDRLSPFIRFGLGASKVQFSELYEPSSLEDTEFEYQAFSWGAGAGLCYAFSPKASASLFADLYVTNGEHLEERKGGRVTGVFVRSSQGMLGIRLAYSL